MDLFINIVQVMWKKTNYNIVIRKQLRDYWETNDHNTEEMKLTN